MFVKIRNHVDWTLFRLCESHLPSGLDLSGGRWKGSMVNERQEVYEAAASGGQGLLRPLSQTSGLFFPICWILMEFHFEYWVSYYFIDAEAILCGRCLVLCCGQNLYLRTMTGNNIGNMGMGLKSYSKIKTELNWELEVGQVFASVIWNNSWIIWL